MLLTSKKAVGSLAAAVALTTALVGSPASAHGGQGHGGGHKPAHSFPAVITLPAGWGAEGVATGRGTSVYSGSLASGAIWKGDLRTGKGAVLVPAHTGRVSVGLKYSRGLLFVAGGPTGAAYVYDAATGADVKTYHLSTVPSFINDVVVTRHAAYFTDSSNAVFYKIRLKRGAPVGDPVKRTLGGQWVQVANQFNANGIEVSADGRRLLIVNSFTGNLFRVNPRTGRARQVTTDTPLTYGDGILRRGSQLAVVRNQLNQIAVLRLNRDLTKGRLVETLTDPDFAVPTTVASFRGWLYAVNARFGLPVQEPFTIVRVDGK